MRLPALTVAALLVPLAASATASIVLGPNTIHGSVRFANTNPDVLAILHKEGMDGLAVGAGQSVPGGYSSNTGYQAAASELGGPYSLSAEASGGVGQVSYQVGASCWVDRRTGGTGNGQYIFRSHPVTIKPVVDCSASADPACVTNQGGFSVDFAEVVTVHRIRFNSNPQDETCLDQPVVINSGSVSTNYGFNLFGHSSVVYYLEPNYPDLGANLPSFSTNLTVVLGTSAYVDTINLTVPITFTANGDAVVDHCIHLPVGSGGGSLGAIQTPVSVAGHQLVSGLLTGYGPDGNGRLADLKGTSLPTDPPSSWPLLQNLVAGNWSAFIDATLDHGAAQIAFRTSRYFGLPRTNATPIPVASGVTSDGRETFGGAPPVYPFVMHPAQYQGALAIYDPFVAAHPGSPSTLSSMAFALDWRDGNGDPVRGPAGGTVIGAGGSYDYAYQSFTARYDGAQGRLATPGQTAPATYGLAIPLLYDQPEQWSRGALSLSFASSRAAHAGDVQNTYYFMTPAETDQATFRLGSLRLEPNAPAMQVQAGQSYLQDHRYCMNEIVMQLSSSNGSFVSPSLGVKGGFKGSDVESGLPADYSVSGSFIGWPPVGGYISDKTILSSARATTGSVAFTLPEGNYTLTPSATFVDDNGHTSTGNYVGTSLSVGCGQRLSLVPGLSISIDPHAGCADVQGGLSTTLSGAISTHGASIDRLWYTLAGADHEICGPATAPCTSSIFSTTIPLSYGDNAVTVSVTSAGLGTASATDSIKTCQPPNRPPVALCRAVTATSAATQCGAAASIDNGSHDPDTGDSITVTQSPAGPYPVGDTEVTLTVTDSKGAQAYCTQHVTVLDNTPPSLSCTRTGAAGGDGLYLVTASDNCGAQPIFLGSYPLDSGTTIRITPANLCGVSRLEDGAAIPHFLVGGGDPSISVADASGNAAQASCGLVIAPPPACRGLGAASSFNAFVLGNFTGSSSDVEGALAAGGNISLSSYAVGIKLPKASLALAAGGGLKLTNGQIYGDVRTGSAPAITGGTVFGSVANGAPVDFNAAAKSLTSLSKAYAALPATNQVMNQWGGLYLTGTNASLNVFNMNASALSGAWGIQLQAPAQSVVVVNITGASAAIRNMGISLSGPPRENVIFNFPDATTLTLQGIGLPGSVLAPNAAVSFANGNVDGTLIAASFTGGGQVNLHPFGACVPVPAPDLCAGVVCGACDACHTAGTCDARTGLCSTPAAADGAACGPGASCLRGDCTASPL